MLIFGISILILIPSAVYGTGTGKLQLNLQFLIRLSYANIFLYGLIQSTYYYLQYVTEPITTANATTPVGTINPTILNTTSIITAPAPNTSGKIAQTFQKCVIN